MQDVPNELKLVGQHADLIQVWLWKNVGIFAWTSQVTGASTAALSEIVEHIIQLLPEAQRFSGVHLVPNKLELPDAAGRSGLVQILNQHEEHFACIAILLGGIGFWASAVRSFITGVRVLVPRSFDVRVASSLPELIAWLPEEHHERTGVAIDPAGLTRAVEVCRQWQEQALEHRRA